MKKFKIAVYTGIRKVEIRESEWADPAPGYVSFKTKCSGICGSDLHVYEGHWDQPEKTASGHEAAGTICALGEGVTGLNDGDRVTFECFSHCGVCIYCANGDYNHCLHRKGAFESAHGGFSEYTTVHASSVYKLPADMSFEQGALVEPLAVANRAVAQTGATYRDRLAVIGGGTIGQLCLAVAQTGGIEEILVTVKYHNQEVLAKNYNADHIVNISDDAASDSTTPNRTVKEYSDDITGGMGLDAVIVTVTGDKALDDALSIVRKRGKVVLLAGYSKPAKASLGTIISKELILTGSNCYGYSRYTTDFQSSIDLIQSKKIDVAQLVTHRYPLECIAQAFKTAADKRTGAVKVHVCQNDGWPAAKTAGARQVAHPQVAHDKWKGP